MLSSGLDLQYTSAMLDTGSQKCEPLEAGWHLKEQGVVEDDLGRGDAQLQDAVVDGPRALQGAQRLLQVAIEAPQLEAAVQAALHGALPLRCFLQEQRMSHHPCG